MNTSRNSNFEAMGLGHYLPGQNAFTAVPPKGADKPPKAKHQRQRKTKAQQAAIALETPEERLLRQRLERKALDKFGRPTIDLAPRTVGAIRIYSEADADKTKRIKRGRAI